MLLNDEKLEKKRKPIQSRTIWNMCDIPVPNCHFFVD